jgi:hypothetical protein
MATFATVQELATHLQTEFDDTQDAAAQQALELATGIIQAFTGQHIFPGTSVETAQGPSNFTVLGGTVVVRQRPVTAVTSVTVNGREAEFTFDGRSGIVVVRTVDPVTQTWPDDRPTVVVAYEHGTEDIPPMVKAVCLELANQMFSNPNGYVQFTAGPFAASHGSHSDAAVGASLTLKHERMLASLRR